MNPSEIKILAFAGSTRAESLNKKLIRIAIDMCSRLQFNTTYIDLKFYPLPLYDGDLEEEIILPENAHALRDMLVQNDGFIFSCPEYNSSISGVFKNVIDWCSRPHLNEPPLACFKNKPVSLLSASPGSLGGLRGLAATRSILENLGCLVMPEQFALKFASDAFNKEGNLKDEATEAQLKQTIDAFCFRLEKLKA